jgi:hypothetical protein
MHNVNSSKLKKGNNFFKNMSEIFYEKKGNNFFKKMSEIFYEKKGNNSLKKMSDQSTTI